MPEEALANGRPRHRHFALPQPLRIAATGIDSSPQAPEHASLVIPGPLSFGAYRLQAPQRPVR